MPALSGNWEKTLLGWKIESDIPDLPKKLSHFKLDIKEVIRLMKRKKETLDPENWEEFKDLGYKIIDDIVYSLQNDTEYRFEFPPKEVGDKICIPLREEGEGEKAAYDAFKDYIAPYSMGKLFIRTNYWGWVVGSGTPFGIYAQMLMAHMIASSESLCADGYVHQHVITWIKQMLDYPEEGGGIIVGGGSEANFTGLAVARNAMSKVDMKARGVQDIPQKMTLYVSEEGHHCLERSVELLGLGNENLRWVKTNKEYQVDVNALEKEINLDREAGYHPFCIIGCAGTVNSGVFDDFNSLRALADRENMWIHIDGAFGAWVKLSDTHRRLADGMELADSLAVDLHKWMNIPYGIGCTLVKDRVAHYSTFVYGHEADYLKSSHELLDDQLNNATQLSLDLSRSYTSLKAYLLLRAYGRGKYARLVQQNIDQIGYFADKVNLEPNVELTAPVVSNVACFRYNPGGIEEDQLASLNKMIRDELYKDTFGIVSDTVMNGIFSLRVCNVSYRSRYKDFDLLLSRITSIGNKLFKDLF